MNEFDKMNIEELLSCYIDGQLSQRGRTEVKRLLQHDKSIADKLTKMQRQKELLNSLPLAQAPPDLVKNIKIRLAKRPVLEKSAPGTDESAGARHLLFRRVLTAAAMFILVGALAVVVFNVIIPASPPEETIASKDTQPLPKVIEPKLAIVDSGLKTEDPEPELYPFKAALEFATADSIAVNGFIKKVIYNNGLLGSTIPKRQATQSAYHVTCTAGQMVALLDDLEAVWDKCRRTSLTVYGETAASNIVIDSVTSAQAIAVFGQTKPDERIELAKTFADFNAVTHGTPTESVFAAGTSDKETEFVPSVPIKPELTRPEQPPVRRDQPETAESINLIITVTGL